MCQENEALRAGRRETSEGLRSLADMVLYRQAFRAELRQRLADRAQSLNAKTTARKKGLGSRAPFPWVAQAVSPLSRVLERGLAMRKGLALAAVVVAIIAVGTMVCIPSVRAQMAAWFGFDRQESLAPLFVEILARAPWDAPEGTSFEMHVFTIRKERWVRWSKARDDGFQIPEPGTQIPFRNGSSLPVPGYLPKGYRWQGIADLLSSAIALGMLPMGGTSGAGGGDPLPPYDRNVVNYLIGGDPADRLLVLAQLERDLDAGYCSRRITSCHPEDNRQQQTAVKDPVSDHEESQRPPLHPSSMCPRYNLAWSCSPRQSAKVWSL